MENPKHMENTLASSSGTVSPEDQSKNPSTESKCPFNARSLRSHEPRLVAESGEPESPAPALRTV